MPAHDQGCVVGWLTLVVVPAADNVGMGAVGLDGRDVPRPLLGTLRRPSDQLGIEPHLGQCAGAFGTHVFRRLDVQQPCQTRRQTVADQQLAAAGDKGLQGRNRVVAQMRIVGEDGHLARPQGTPGQRGLVDLVATQSQIVEHHADAMGHVLSSLGLAGGLARSCGHDDGHLVRQRLQRADADGRIQGSPVPGGDADGVDRVPAVGLVFGPKVALQEPDRAPARLGQCARARIPTFAAMEVERQPADGFRLVGLDFQCEGPGRGEIKFHVPIDNHSRQLRLRLEGGPNLKHAPVAVADHFQGRRSVGCLPRRTGRRRVGVIEPVDFLFRTENDHSKKPNQGGSGHARAPAEDKVQIIAAETLHGV